MPTSSEQKHPQSPSAQELVSGVVRLVSLPEVCLRVSEMLEDPHTSANDLGRVIGRDTGLTARLLKIVNSAFYGFPSRIETVSRAVAIIGMRELRGLVLAASAIEAFSKVPNDVLNMAHFWRHSVYCGVVGQLLAGECHVLHKERLFVAGLLHDIGKLIICNKLPRQARTIQQLCDDNGMLDFEAEREVLGFDHAEVGGELLQQWRMPDTLTEAVRFHHNPAEAVDSAMDTCIIHIANVMTGIAEEGVEIESNLQPIDPYAWKVTGLNESVFDEILSEAGPRFTEALDAILPRSFFS
jgi:putative nucleotidyltransferase with HDIG domain